MSTDQTTTPPTPVDETPPPCVVVDERGAWFRANHASHLNARRARANRRARHPLTGPIPAELRDEERWVTAESRAMFLAGIPAESLRHEEYVTRATRLLTAMAANKAGAS